MTDHTNCINQYAEALNEKERLRIENAELKKQLELEKSLSELKASNTILASLEIVIPILNSIKGLVENDEE